MENTILNGILTEDTTKLLLWESLVVNKTQANL